MDKKLKDKFEKLDELGRLDTKPAEALRELAKVIEILHKEGFYCVASSSIGGSGPLKIEIGL